MARKGKTEKKEEERKSSGESTAEGSKPAASIPQQPAPPPPGSSSEQLAAPRPYYPSPPSYPYYPYPYPPSHQHYSHRQSAPHLPSLQHVYPPRQHTQVLPSSARIPEQRGAMSHPFPQYVTPEARPSSTSARAFASPPSNLRQKPAASSREPSTAATRTLAPAAYRSGKFVEEA